MSNPEQLVRQADNYLKGSTGVVGKLFGLVTAKVSEDNCREAVIKFKEAGNAYRNQNNLQNAAQCFERAAEVEEKQLHESYAAIMSLQDAFKCYREASPLDAARCLEHCVYLHTNGANARYSNAAKILMDLAELQQNALDDPKAALESWQTAVRYYTQENQPAFANKCRVNAGQLAAVMGEYYKALGFFVDAAEKSRDSRSLSFQVKDYLFKAAICQLATRDMVGTKKALESWGVLFEPHEPKGPFIAELVDAIESQDLKRYAEAQKRYETANINLDQWIRTVLREVGKEIEGEEEDFA